MFLIELKKMFYRKSLLLISLLSPVIVLIIFASVMIPSLIRLNGVGIINNVFIEDKSPVINIFINSYVEKTTGNNSKSLLKIRKVNSYQAGYKLLSDNDANIFTYIPADTIDKILASEKFDINIYTKLAYAFEASIYVHDLQKNISLAEKLSPSYRLVAQFLSARGLNDEQVDKSILASQKIAGRKFAFRKAMFDYASAAIKKNDIPVLYYIVSIVTIFISLGMLPIVWFTSVDLNSVLIKRSAFKGSLKLRYLVAKLLASALFICLTIALLIPANSLLRIKLHAAHQVVENPLLIMVGIVIAAAFLASLSIFIASVIPNGIHGIWFAFYMLIIMLFISGGLYPIEKLPPLLKIIGMSTPLFYIKEIIGAIFGVYSQAIYLRSIFMLVLYSVVLFIVSYFLLAKRRVSA